LLEEKRKLRNKGKKRVKSVRREWRVSGARGNRVKKGIL
jgi:hypothetical protein